MDPVTIGLLAASVAGQFGAHMLGSSQAKENLDYQKMRDAQMMRMAQAARTDPFGNRTYYDAALNEWISQLTPQQKRIAMGLEREQLLNVMVDAERNRQTRGRMFRAGEMAQPGFDRALAGYQYDRPESEGSIRSKIARLLTTAQSGPDTTNINLRTAGNIPTLNYGPSPDSGASQLAKTFLGARSQALSESSARDVAHTNRYGPAIDRYLGIMSGGGGAPIQTQSPGTAGAEAQQADMARLLASIAGQGTQAIGSAGSEYAKSLSALAPDTRGNAALITALGKYSKTRSPTDVGSATRYNPDTIDDYLNERYFDQSTRGSPYQFA
jgi:hypothetical protein